MVSLKIPLTEVMILESINIHSNQIKLVTKIFMTSKIIVELENSNYELSLAVTQKLSLSVIV